MRGNTEPQSKTLCWECRKAATKECSWARAFEPVEGWEAVRVPERCHSNGQRVEGSYIVKQCPEFERDSCEHGLKRWKKENCAKCWARDKCGHRKTEGGGGR